MNLHGSKWAITFWSILGLAIATQYNACSQSVNFKTSASTLKQQLLSASVILINGDAEFTNDMQVEVSLQNDLADEYYLTNDSTCATGGTWAKMQDRVAWKLSGSNGELFAYAKFRNTSEGIATDCEKDSIIHDGEQPKILLNSPVIGTNVVGPVFNFLAYDGISGIKEIKCKWPGKAEEICNYSSSNGNLSEGIFNVEVVAEDRAGNKSDTTVQVLTVDRTAPVVTVNSAPAAISGSPDAVYAFVANDNLSGVKSIECSKENSTSFAPCISPLNWTVPEGSHKLYIRAVDMVGNVSNEIEHSFVVDFTAPIVRILTGPSSFERIPTATFTFDGTDEGLPLTKFECRVDGGLLAPCSSPKSISGLADGLHKFEVVGIDSAGNSSSPVSRTWIVDSAKPTVLFTLTPNANGNSDSAVFRYTISDVGSGVQSAECALDSGAFATCDVATTNLSGLIDGAHSFRVRGIDNAGNVGVAVKYSWVVDRVAPTLVLVSGPAAMSNLDIANFVYTATDAGSGVDRVECRLDAAAYSPCNSLTAHQIANLYEGARRVAIRAIDNSGNLSNEVVVNWIVDITAPTISMFQTPVSVIATNSVQAFGFTADDAGSGVKSLGCKLNSATVTCASGQLVRIANQAVGLYNFTITAMDSSGNVATKVLTWMVSTPNEQIQMVKVGENNKVDIVVIIDNSASMAGEMTAMGDKFSSFVNQLSGLDWQVGIVTTDPSKSPNNPPKKDGRMVELVGMPGQYILNSSMSPTLADKLFRDTIQMPTDGSGKEFGIGTAIRSIERSSSGNPIDSANAAMFRPDAALAFIIVSDAYDYLNQPDDLIKAVQKQWAGQKAFAFHSIVVPESPFTIPGGGTKSKADPCYSYRESVAFDGRTYHTLSDMTGGVKGSVCTTDYSSQLKDMGKSTVDLVTSATLACQPVDANADGQVNESDIQVTLQDGTDYSTFTLTGTKLTFKTALPLGMQKLRYFCL